MTRPTTGSSAAAGVTGRPDAGSSSAAPHRAASTCPPPWRVRGASPSTIGAHHPCRSPTQTSFARPAPRSRGRPQEVDALPAGAATVIDVREASEWDQGHLPGAHHISKSYIEQQIEARPPIATRR